MARTSGPVALPVHRRALVAGLTMTMLISLAPLASAAGSDYRETLDLTFPVAGKVWFDDDYKAWRSGGRRHQGTDVFAPKGTAVHAAVDGAICGITGIGEAMPSFGYAIVICGDDGRRYGYYHLSNDRLGTDDGRGGPEAAYAPGIGPGMRVRRGQHIGFVGDSGNAEETPPHLHFEIHDDDLRDSRLDPDPWKPNRLNPYPSLIAAQRRGDVPGAASVPPSARGDGAESRLLRLSSPLQRGDDVRELQQGLAKLGYRDAAGRSLAVDGWFGPATDAAVRAFQADAGLNRDYLGIVGPNTMRALAQRLAGGATAASATATSTSSTGGSLAWPGRYLRLQQPLLRGDDVRAFQARLAELGYRDGSQALVVDGIYGPQTDRIARRFIADVGLPAVAIVGPRTWEAAFG